MTISSPQNQVPLLKTALPGPRAAEWIARDMKVISTSYTRGYPLVAARGSGCTLEDVDGNLFLDFTAGIAVNATGHSHPDVVAAIADQAAKLIHMSGTDFYYAPEIELAERLVQLTPGDHAKRVFFANSGAETIEAALKLARHHSGRQRVISCYGAFHGRTYGALSLGGSKALHQHGFGPVLSGVHRIHFDSPRAELEELFATVCPADEVAANANDRPRAKELAVAAYLEGVEPHEASLRARDAAATARIEEAFLQLRRTIAAGNSVDADAVRRDVARATMLLDGAEEHARKDRSVPFFAALAIALREGFEIALLISALLAFVRKSGHPESAPYVHCGWLLALPAGAATWFAVGAALGGARRELTEGVLTLVAASMLLFVSHFVLGKLESKRWLDFLRKKTTESSTRPWPLLLVAFVAAYREAIEIVLFFRALTLDSPGRAAAIAAGCATGCAILAALVFGMQQLGRRLNPRPVMVASGLLLTALAIALVGQGVRALQEGGYVPLTPIGNAAGGLPSLGLYPTLEGLGTQLVVLALVLLPVWLDRRRAEASATPKAA